MAKLESTFVICFLHILALAAAQVHIVWDYRAYAHLKFNLICLYFLVQGPYWRQELRDILRFGKILFKLAARYLIFLWIFWQVDRVTAKSLCQSNGATLVSFENADEQVEISDFLLFFDCEQNFN